jgi:hypothetical protein
MCPPNRTQVGSPAAPAAVPTTSATVGAHPLGPLGAPAAARRTPRAPRISPRSGAGVDRPRRCDPRAGDHHRIQQRVLEVRAVLADPRPQPSGDPGTDPARAVDSVAQPRRSEASICGWCGRPIDVKATGRLPTWCSASCRQRAWEQARAASSGLSAAQLVERRVETPVPLPPARRDWPRILGELVTQLDTGRIYNRDLDELSVAVAAVDVAVTRRMNISSRTAPRPR